MYLYLYQCGMFVQPYRFARQIQQFQMLIGLFQKSHDVPKPCVQTLHMVANDRNLIWRHNCERPVYCYMSSPSGTKFECGPYHCRYKNVHKTYTRYVQNSWRRLASRPARRLGHQPAAAQYFWHLHCHLPHCPSSVVVSVRHACRLQLKRKFFL